jgi:hypothetical protein
LTTRYNAKVRETTCGYAKGVDGVNNVLEDAPIPPPSRRHRSEFRTPETQLRVRLRIAREYREYMVLVDTWRDLACPDAPAPQVVDVATLCHQDVTSDAQPSSCESDGQR